MSCILMTDKSCIYLVIVSTVLDDLNCGVATRSEMSGRLEWACFSSDDQQLLERRTDFRYTDSVSHNEASNQLVSDSAAVKIRITILTGSHFFHCVLSKS